MELKENERIDDLQLDGLKIIQNTKGFCFGVDSVLLSEFAKNIKNNSKIIDLGTGTGVLCILLSEKTEGTQFIGVEIQEDVADMARRSVCLNNLEDRIKILNENILNLKDIYKKGEFDVVITNPPYKKVNTGVINKEDKKVLSRHEITASLNDFLHVSSYLLKDYGEFYMVHRPERLVDIFCAMREENIEPKLIKFVYPNLRDKTNKPAKLVLIKGIKKGNSFLKVESE